MSKALLIIICDFLLLSLLSLAKFEEMPEPKPQPKTGVPDRAGAEKDLMGVLKYALEEERESREELAAELAAARESLESREGLLAEREQRIRDFQQNLQEKQEEAARLARQRAELQQQYAATRETAEKLRQELNTTSSEAQTSKERAEMLQAQLRARQEAIQNLEGKLDQIDKNREAAEAAKNQLANQLQRSEIETQMAREQVQTMREQVQTMRGDVQTMRGEVETVREEKTRLAEHAEKLAEGVTTLAQKSSQLTEEIRENRPLAANTIFNRFISNRVETTFRAVRRGIFGLKVDRNKETKTVLVRDGSQIFALYHVNDTPLVFWNPGTDWDQLNGYVRRGGSAFSMVLLSFSAIDPRIVLVPVGEAQARQLGANIYSLAQDPFRFQEAVVVGAGEGYYGEAKFQIDPSLPRYVKMERHTFSRLFGDFSPSSGDLVFSKNGDLLGIMVNSEYCAVIDSFRVARSIRLGPEAVSPPTGRLLAQMRDWVDALPFNLQ